MKSSADIFGKDKVSLRVNMTRSNPHQVQSIYVSIPKHFMEKYQSVTISDDYMFFNGIPLFVTVIHHIKFITDLMTKDQRTKTVIDMIK